MGVSGAVLLLGGVEEREADVRCVRRFAAQHGADLDSWFAHPATSDLELHSLSRHMTAYLMYASSFSFFSRLCVLSR